MNRGAGDLRQFGLGTMVLLQFKGSILPSSMAPSGEDLVRLPDLISMGRHGHWALSHIVPCMDNGSLAVILQRLHSSHTCILLRCVMALKAWESLNKVLNFWQHSGFKRRVIGDLGDFSLISLKKRISLSSLNTRIDMHIFFSIRIQILGFFGKRPYKFSWICYCLL